jgi:hypothetical protein
VVKVKAPEMYSRPVMTLGLAAIICPGVMIPVCPGPVREKVLLFKVVRSIGTLNPTTTVVPSTTSVRPDAGDELMMLGVGIYSPGRCGADGRSSM